MKYLCLLSCFDLVLYVFPPMKALNGTKILLQKAISSLSEIRYLRIINIIIRPYQRGTFSQPINDVTLHEVTEWVQWSKDILSQGIQKCEDDQEPRKVVVHHEKRRSDIHLVNVHKSR